MTAQQGKQPDGGQGRSGDIQARQTDDGSFELVVENPAASTSSDATGDGSTKPGPQPQKRRVGGAKRLSIAVVFGLAAVGVLIYAFSGDPETQTADRNVQIKAGFRPYLGGPGEGSSAAPRPEVRREEPAFDKVDELDEPNVAADAVPPGDEEDWAVEAEGEVIVIEEEHPPEEFEDIEEVDEDESGEDESGEDMADAPEKPRIDRSKLPRFRERMKLPTQTPEIKHLPSPQLNRIQPQLPQLRDKAGAGDEAYLDEEDNYEDEGYEEEDNYDDEGYEEEYEEEGYEDEGADQEYDEEDNSFDEYDEGY